MGCTIGLDIGGTKIAGAAFDAKGESLAQFAQPTPKTYEAFLETCRVLVDQLEQKCGRADSLGVGLPGHFDLFTGFISCQSNLPHISDRPLRADLERLLKRDILFENDANCAALAEAVEGAGRGHRAVFGLIMGTGIGGGFVLNGRVVSGANGIGGEIGHLPLPHYEESDGERVPCGCGQTGCIERLAAGAALARRYHAQTGLHADAKHIAAQARQGDPEALHVLDLYYTTVAKAMVAILHSFDPDIITVSGGLNSLPGLYTEVPKRWGKYAINPSLVTRFVPATFGAIAGLRGAALLGKSA